MFNDITKKSFSKTKAPKGLWSMDQIPYFYYPKKILMIVRYLNVDLKLIGEGMPLSLQLSPYI